MRILVVDRVKLFQQIIASLLSGTLIGYEFKNDGHSALTAMERDYFDIICISFFLDDMDAIELCQNIRRLERYAYTPIILFTTEESQSVLKSALRVGITDVFHKKDCDQLINFIERFALHNQHLTGRILYVEDTLSQRLLLEEILKRRGFQIDSFADAESALLKFNDTEYDIVISDIVLDGSMSGVMLANRIRRLDGPKGDTPILAITAFDNISRRIGLYHLGINDYVIKPIVEEELFARMNRLIDNFRYMRRIQAEKQAALDTYTAQSEFFAIMSGELKNQLNPIISALQALQQTPESAGLAEPLKNLETSGKNLLHNIVEIQDISNIESQRSQDSPPAQAANLPELISESLALLEPAIQQQGIATQQSYPDHLNRAQADPARIKQMLIILLSNAIKYNHQNGKILISANNLPELGKVSVSIRDTGPAVSAGIKDLFSQTGDLSAEQLMNNRGVGLVTAQKLIHKMGGNIRVSSKAGEGATFTLCLPALLE